MALRLIQVGTGNQGRRWCRQFLPPNVDDGTVEVVAAVDVDEAAHEHARDALGLSEGDCFTDVERAVAEREADALALVVPPRYREDLVGLALDDDLDVITEKPIAETMDGAVRIVDAVEDAGAKLGVTMSHRFRRDVTTLRRALATGDDGAPEYLHCRYAVNARSRGAWAGERLYDFEEHPLLVDGAIHHLDLLADLADGQVETVFCTSWNPEYSDFAGDPNAVVQMVTDDGTTVVYEGRNTAAENFNGWGDEHVRANCPGATYLLDGGVLRRFPYDPEAEHCLGNVGFEDGQPVDLLEREKWGNAWLIEQFADWCDGGEPMATDARSNLRSMALVFAAIESAETGEAVDVESFLEQVGAQSEPTRTGE